MALIVSNRLAGAKVDILHRDPTGHTLIATLQILGRLSLLLVISHAPPSSDAARAAYFTSLLKHIPPPDPAHAPATACGLRAGRNACIYAPLAVRRKYAVERTGTGLVYEYG